MTLAVEQAIAELSAVVGSSADRASIIDPLFAATKAARAKWRIPGELTVIVTQDSRFLVLIKEKWLHRGVLDFNVFLYPGK